MILPFSTQIGGKPTYFIEKIWESLFDLKRDGDACGCYANYREAYKKKTGTYWDEFNNGSQCIEKIHSIREDKHDRWKVGNKIHFTINNRTKNSFQFAPVLLVKSIQEFCIERVDYINDSKVFIDGREVTRLSELKTLARNDGFETLISFWLYFNYSFKGKIIHWTDFKY